MSRPASPAMAYQRPGLWALRKGPTSGAKLYFQSDARAFFTLSSGRMRPRPDLEGPALPEDLVDLAAVVRADAVDVVLVGNLVIVFAVEQLAIEVAAAALEDLADGRANAASPTSRAISSQARRAARYSELSQATLPNQGWSSVLCCAPFDEPFAARPCGSGHSHGQLDLAAKVP